MKNNHTSAYNKKPLTANVLGATGLVGKQLVNSLLENQRFQKVRIFVRRDSGKVHPKLEQQIVDFGKNDSWEKHLKGDILFSALGTTLKNAGSKEKQYEVDVGLNLEFALKARQKGIETFVLVSAVGANAESRIFYNRMKGELDDAVSKIGFRKLTILRPSMLAGDRDENRLAEKLFIPVVGLVTRFIFRKYRPIDARTVATAMVNAALRPFTEKVIWTADELFDLAEEKQQ
jgi:uncharacterized protein YbjT (DUF2867 family)